MRLARSQFSSTSSLALATRSSTPWLATVQEGIDAGLAAGASIIVLCSSDDEYAEFAPEAYKYLAGRAEFVVAGAPACADDLKAVGIENFINVKSNVLETLRQFNQKLGIN